MSVPPGHSPLNSKSRKPARTLTIPSCIVTRLQPIAQSNLVAISDGSQRLGSQAMNAFAIPLMPQNTVRSSSSVK